MGTGRKPWSRAKVRRVIDSVHSGGFAAYRSRLGWSIWLSGDGAGPSRRRCFVPDRSLHSRHSRWLGNRLTGAYRHALERLDGVQMISGSEARSLLRWCTRWVRPRSRPRLTAAQRAQATKFQNWRQRAYRVPETVQGGGYSAERSRRGWVVRLSSSSGRLRGIYLVPFRALGPDGMNWTGEFLVASLLKRLSGIEGTVLTNDQKGSAPTGWPASVDNSESRLRSRASMAGETWTRRRAS